jgi:hypothetical protein
MSSADPKKVAQRYQTSKRVKTAGEVRFIKDHGDDSNAWAWGQHPPSGRLMDPEHKFNKKCSKDMAKVLRATLSSLGHAMSAYSTFAKIKSRDISPDGNLGGRGYIMEIKAMRRQYMNIVEALSALSDTLYDEVTADHWQIAQAKVLEQVMEDIEDIKEDPEAWALQEQEENDTPVDEDGKPVPSRDYLSDRSKR